MARVLYFVCVCVFNWYKWFSEGRESTKNDQCPDQLVSVSTPQTVTKINEIVRIHHCMIIRMIAETIYKCR